VAAVRSNYLPPPLPLLSLRRGVIFTEYAPHGARCYSLKTSTWLDPANRISLMVLDPSGLVA